MGGAAPCVRFSPVCLKLAVPRVTKTPTSGFSAVLERKSLRVALQYVKEYPESPQKRSKKPRPGRNRTTRSQGAGANLDGSFLVQVSSASHENSIAGSA